MNRIFHILTLLLLNFTAMAQRYPVTVTPVLLPPYTVNLADLVEDKGKPKIMTTIMVNDLTVKNLRVRLHVKLESSGVTIENIKNTAVSPMFIGGGETRILTGIDLAQYLKLDNLEFHGYSKEKYLQTGQLPGGLWRLTIEIQDFDSGRQLSNRGMFTAWVSVYDPPQLLAPRDNVEAPDNASLPLVFSWLASKHTGGIVPVQYKLEVWRLNMEYLPAQTWVESQTPIYTATTSATSFTAIPAALNLEPGQRYCWRVTVIDPTGQAQINKDGESEVRTFVYQHTCPDVTDIDISVNNTRVDFSWNGSNQHSYYQVGLVDMDGSSTLKDCYDTRFTYYDFERGSNWKVSVKAVCPGGLESDWATYQDFSIDPPGTTPTVEECPDCGCAEAPEQQAIENQNLKELKANDTIVNRTGRTRFIIVNATANGDGSYNGQFHLWLELWKVKVLCDYTDLKVNTDGVILDGQWRSVNNPALMINTAELASAVVQLKNDIATVTYDNSIRDTVMLVDAIQTIYKDEEGHYQAVLDNGEVKDVTTQLENKGRTLITDSEGNQMVLTSDHQIMSTEQYKATGKNNTLISNSNSEKDKQVSTGKVMFSSVEAQKYGFDAYSADNAYDAVYPALEGGYRPAYKSIAKWQTDVVTASPMDKVSFRNQMGAPYAVKNGTIELRGDATPGESPVYAHVAETDSTTKVVGKLNLLTFDEKQVQLCLVPVNGARLPNASELQAELNSIFAPAVASVKVTTHGGVTIGYANGKNFVHGGSGWLSVYNTDQKAAIQALTDAQEDVYYLFFVDNATKLDENDKPTIVAGYMPISRRFGFLYDSPTTKYIAHELAHGAFSLHHTFSDESESYHAASGTTPNLMDYSTGTILNHLQWQWMHESHTNLLGFLDDESEGEMQDPCWQKGRENWKKVSEQLYQAKKELKYDCECGYDYAPGLRRSYFGLTDGNILLVDQKSDGYETSTPNYYLFIKEINDWCAVDLENFEDDCLSCELKVLAEEIERKSAIFVGRYVLPIEDAYILIEGKDFDGVESSRALAGSFLLIDVVPGGKLLQPILKGAKLGVKTTAKGAIKVYSTIGKTRKVVFEQVDDIIKPTKWIEGEVDEVVETLEDVKYIDKEGKEVSGSIQVVRQGENVGAKSIKASFKIGDEIAGISIKQIKEGSNGKIAIIGRSMGNDNTKGVKDVYLELKQKGYDVEIFDNSSLKDDWLEKMNVAMREFDRETNNWTQRLSNERLMQLDIYKLNKEWANMIKNKGYTIIDMGDFNNVGFSVFYAMEKSVIFK